MKKMRGMVALCVALSVAAGSSALLAQKDDKKEVKRTKAEQVDIDTLVSAVDAVSAGKPAPAEISVSWESNHAFRAPDGTTYVPFTVKLDRSKLTTPTTALYIRLADRGTVPTAPGKGKDKNGPVYPTEKFEFVTVGPEGLVSRFVQAKPGDYDLYVAAKDKGTVEKIDKNYTPKVGVLKYDLALPDYTRADLTTSSVLLATSIAPLDPADTGESDPYVFGRTKIVPSRDAKYRKADTLELIYWVYGATGDAAGRPDLMMENSFYQKLPEGEKFFNKTQPQGLNSQNLPADFPLSAPLPGTLQVPLLSFPAGDYRLEIKITDKPSGKAITQNVNFSVAAS